MKYFDEATLRLKQQLKLTTDKDVAEHLGISPSAWVGRKNRDHFPRKELLALSALRPDLHIDVHYVLADFPTLSTSLEHQKAVRAATQQDAAALAALSSEERLLLDYFRQASAPVRRAALGALLSAVPDVRVSGSYNQRDDHSVNIGGRAGKVNVNHKGRRNP